MLLLKKGCLLKPLSSVLLVQLQNVQSNEVPNVHSNESKVPNVHSNESKKPHNNYAMHLQRFPACMLL